MNGPMNEVMTGLRHVQLLKSDAHDCLPFGQRRSVRLQSSIRDLRYLTGLHTLGTGKRIPGTDGPAQGTIVRLYSLRTLVTVFSALLCALSTAQLQAWVSGTSGTGNTVDTAVDIAVDPTGAIAVVGMAGPDLLVAKYAANGTQVWAKKYNGAGNGPDLARAVAMDASGNVYVTGKVQSSQTAAPISTIRFASADGAVVWTHLDSASDGSGVDLAVSGTSVYVLGHRRSNGTLVMQVAKLSASTGASQWTTAYNGNGNDVEAVALGLDGAGNVYAAGTQDVNPLGSDIALMKLTAAGVQSWSVVLDGLGGVDVARSLAVQSTGHLFVVGSAQFFEFDEDMVTFKVRQSDGGVEWERMYDGFGLYRDEAQNVALGSDGSAYVVGYLDDGRYYHTVAVHYDSAGNELYAVTRISTKDTAPSVRASLANTGVLYVGTTATSGATRADFYVFAVGVDGSVPWYRLWNDAFNGNDWLAGLALDPQGSVIACGSAFHSTAQDNFSVVKYQPVRLTPGATEVVGGLNVTFTLALNVNPASTATFTLQDNSSFASVPASASISTSSASTTFTMTTTPVATSELVTVTARTGAGWVTSSVTIRPPSVSNLTVSPTTIVGGNTGVATVTLNGGAPIGGQLVTLWDSSPSVSVPGAVTIPQGTTSLQVPVTTLAVNTTTTADIFAYANGVARSATLTLSPNGPNVLSVSPASLIGGATATGTVTLNSPAPSGGAVVNLSSSNVAVTVPASVTVPAGALIQVFNVNSLPVATTTSVTLTATRNGVSKSVNLSVIASAIASVAVSPTAATGGEVVTGTVSLTGPAPTGGRTISLSSNALSRATVPSSVVVPAGATSAGFTITTFPQTADGNATIIAGLNGANRTATLTVLRPVLLSIMIMPNSIKGGQSVSAIATLTGRPKEGTTGVTVTLTSSNPTVASVPASIRIPAGATSAGFTITTTAVTSDTVVTITGTGVQVRTATLVVVP